MIISLSAPFLILIYCLIWLNMGKPVIFKQRRPGLNGRAFKLFKFRTMTVPTDGDSTPATDAQRLTALGKFLRNTSLDELPEFFNILKGDISVVGPRPLLMQYLGRYAPHQARRHEVKPGLTGWAQINGRNRLSWEDRFDLDVWYVDNLSWRLDTKIMAITLFKIIAREGIHQHGEATMTEFMGSTDGKNDI